MAKLWGGRFSKNTNELVDAFNASIDFDKRLYHEDIRGSIAHAGMLAKCGIIPAEDGEKIIAGLKDILADIEAGNFHFDVALEDIHMNVEARLTERIGSAGARLHTARSRNDQVALDMHMYMKREVAEIAELLLKFEEALLTVAKKHEKTLMPGYTHLQRAQPITFAHHMLAYFNMLQRDFRRLLGVWEGADMMPLGAGAIAGTTFPIDRFMVAEELNFGTVYPNSMDAVSDRDYIIEFLSFASTLMMHMSRLSEEICLWSSTEFGFVELDDAFATGSSMMPQKKNPDISELVRGKTGRVYGHLMAMLTTAKGLPLTYNKDLQEDKEGFFDAIDTVKFTLAVYRDMILTMTVNVDMHNLSQAVKQRAAAGQINTVINNISSQLRRAFFQNTAHSSNQRSNSILQCHTAILGAYAKGSRQAGNHIAAAYSNRLIASVGNNSSNIHFDFFSRALTDKHIMYLLHMTHNSLIKMVAADTDRRINNNTAKAQHSDIGSTAAYINNHIAARYGNINTGTKSRCQRFLNQIGFGSTALGSSLHNSTLFY